MTKSQIFDQIFEKSIFVKNVHICRDSVNVSVFNALFWLSFWTHQTILVPQQPLVLKNQYTRD